MRAEVHVAASYSRHSGLVGRLRYRYAAHLQADAPLLIKTGTLELNQCLTKETPSVLLPCLHLLLQIYMLHYLKGSCVPVASTYMR